VYIAGQWGIAAFDRDFERWLAPVAFEPSYGVLRRTVIAADPVEEGAWVASGGTLLYYRPSMHDVMRGAVPGEVYGFYFDVRDPSVGAYLRTSSGWMVATRTGLVSPVSASRVPSSTTAGASSLGEVYSAYPSLRGALPLLTRDADLRSWNVLSAAKSPDRDEIWLGTAGGGLFRVDPLFLKSEQIPFGPLQTGTGALARDSAGVWMAGMDAGGAIAHAGLAHASADLQSWRWLASPAISRSLAGARAFALSVRGERLWVGTDRGVVAIDATRPESALRWSATSGLPGDRVYDVAASDAGAWVAADGGLAFVASDASDRAARGESVRTIRGASVRAYSLLLAGDTLWVGSASGLFLVRGASPDSLPRSVNVRDAARLERPVYALAASDSLVAAATDRELLVIDVAAATLIPRFDAVNIAPVSPVTAIAMDPRTIWLAGPGGVLVVTRASGAARLIAAPGAIPAEARDIVLDRDFAWVATARGVVRLRRASDGGAR
jgi:ligand-binding sensor domain-containing protein